MDHDGQRPRRGRTMAAADVGCSVHLDREQDKKKQWIMEMMHDQDQMANFAVSNFVSKLI